MTKRKRPSTGTTVITVDQAKAITGGRKPFEIVPYERAVLDLQECLTIDEAREWTNISDAYAAWGKIKKDERVIRLARQIKLKAIERMGQLAVELRPPSFVNRDKKTGRVRGGLPAAQSLLTDMGMKRHDAETALFLARNSTIVDEAIKQPRPPSPHWLHRNNRYSSEWHEFTDKIHWTMFVKNLPTLTAPQAAHAAKTGSKNIQHIKAQAIFMYEWLDEFIAHLKS